jgi:NADP-dependent 3-hydroxy acid dehydrogenase YdfG
MLGESFAVLLPNVEDFDLARRYLNRFETGLRAGDALHLAIASNHQVAAIYSLDRTLLAAGKMLALPVSRGIRDKRSRGRREPMVGPLDGRVAWITGAGSGIGRACAVTFARAGAKVALTGRRTALLEETAALIGGRAADVMIAAADVTDIHAVEAAHKRIVQVLGDPLILVNSAGGNVRRRHWANLAPASASEVIDLDLKAMFYCTLAVLPAMRTARDGRIVHIASLAGVSLAPITGPSYAAAKHAVVAMSASLNAEEGINGIRSTCISPGEVETAILDTRPAPPSAAERALMLQPEDVADTALFCVTLPVRACVTDLILLPTDAIHVRFQARSIEALVAASATADQEPAAGD